MPGEPRIDRELANFRRRYWVRRVAAYESFFEPITNRFARRLCDAVELRPGHTVVDVGCGPGALLGELEGRQVLALGVDRVEPMLQRARARVRSPRLVCADAGALPLSSDAARVVLMAFLVPHLPELEPALREARRILRRGGLLACVTWLQPEKSPLTGLVAKVVRDRVRLPANLLQRLYEVERRPDELVDAMLSAGLTVEDVEDVEDVCQVADADAWWRAMTDATTGLTDLLQAIGPQARRDVERCFRAEAERFRVPEGLRVPVAVRSILAKRP